jgi:hypothetical protein
LHRSSFSGLSNLPMRKMITNPYSTAILIALK